MIDPRRNHVFSKISLERAFPVARIRHVPERQPRQQQRYADVWIVRKEKVHMTSLRMPPGVWDHRPYPPGGNAFRPMGKTLQLLSIRIYCEIYWNGCNRNEPPQFPHQPETLGRKGGERETARASPTLKNVSSSSPDTLSPPKLAPNASREGVDPGQGREPRRSAGTERHRNCRDAGPQARA